MILYLLCTVEPWPVFSHSGYNMGGAKHNPVPGNELNSTVSGMLLNSWLICLSHILMLSISVSICLQSATTNSLCGNMALLFWVKVIASFIAFTRLYTLFCVRNCIATPGLEALYDGGGFPCFTICKAGHLIKKSQNSSISLWQGHSKGCG
jgi:hypothetical protein